MSPLATLLRTAAARQVVLPVPGGPWITDTGGQLGPIRGEHWVSRDQLSTNHSSPGGVQQGALLAGVLQQTLLVHSQGLAWLVIIIITIVVITIITVITIISIQDC